MRRIAAPALLLSLACALASAGCRGQNAFDDKKASEVLEAQARAYELVNALKSFTDELLAKVESAPEPKAGVAEAQRLLDARREQMAERIRALKPDGKYPSNKGLWLEAEVDNTERVHRLQVEYADASTRDPDFKARLDKLVSDYDSIFK